MKTAIHLIDDRTPGGVMRMVSFLTSAPDPTCHHSLLDFQDWRRIYPSPDIIVSHLAVSWRNLPTFLAMRARFPSARLIHVEHSYTQSFTAMNVANRGRFFTLLQTSYSLFDSVICVSEAQTTWMRSRNLVASHALETCNSIVDFTSFSDVPPAGPRPKRLGLVGRLDRQKGFDIAIKAFRNLEGRDLELKVFGSGPQEQQLKQLALGDTRIKFLGYSSTSHDIYAQVDAVLMPSRWEAFGLVAAEAFAAGRPVLAANVDALKDPNRKGITLVPGHGTGVWVNGLKTFCENRFNLAPICHSDAEVWKKKMLGKWHDNLAGTYSSA
ncbi:glycosyltransferase family 4 protein [uncultured Pelagimonas sp.]|uniref:glycosyltransferase family 4 protein n=1 Tax=uncultured Pelagimonas sp. TaxID=1618102 RepID=UPI0026141C1B|nr:glycosyltransferase family 4 protein [uncultured Pelagimonas sp.]